MGAFQPDLYPSAARCNIKSPEVFEVTIVYGSSAVASAKGKFLVKVEDTSAGKMTFYFPRTYARLTNFSWGWKKCAAGAVYFPVVLTDAIATADATTGGGTVIVETRTEAGTATDPASGDELCLRFEVANDVVNDSDTLTVTTP